MVCNDSMINASTFSRCLLFLVNWGFDVTVVIEWLSTIVYPFVELMLGTDETVCCELILTILRKSTFIRML